MDDTDFRVEGDYAHLTARGITEETCRFMDYRVGHGDDGEFYHYAVYHGANGAPIAAKVRGKDKAFRWKGASRVASKTLFGAHKWSHGRAKGARMLVVTEGEIDALSVAQAQNCRWPVVSLPNGAQGAVAALNENMDWLLTFESVVLFFDQDEPGREAAQKCAELFPIGKAKIVSFHRKDANEAIMQGESHKIIQAIHNARPYYPDDIIEGSDERVWETLMERPPDADWSYPFRGLDDMTEGIRCGEVVMLAAGTGVGKSQVLREITHHVLQKAKETGDKIGVVALEENVRKTALGMMSLALDVPLHRRGRMDEVSQEELRAAYEATVGCGNVLLYDHFGSMDSKRLFGKLRQMIHAGCRFLVMDHISIVVSGSDEADANERRIIDKLMTTIRSLVEETQVSMFIVSHLRKADGTPHEEGGRVRLDDLRGSGTLKQVPDIIIGVERDQQAESLEERCTARLRVLKNRHCSETGDAGAVRYDPQTGRYLDVGAMNPFAEGATCSQSGTESPF